MNLYITRPSLSGNVLVTVKDKNNNVIFENKNIDLSCDIEIEDAKSEEITLEITYISKLINSKKERFKYVSNVFWYHIFPIIYRDNELYKYGAKLYVTKTYQISKLRDDCSIEYEPYHENLIVYDDGEIIHARESVVYKYGYLSNIALVMSILFYLTLLTCAIVCNYLWIKEIK